MREEESRAQLVRRFRSQLFICKSPRCSPELLDRQLELAGTERGPAQLMPQLRFEVRGRWLRESSLEERDRNVVGPAVPRFIGRLAKRVHPLRIAGSMGR